MLVASFGVFLALTIQLVSTCPLHFTKASNGLCYYDSKYIVESPVNGLQQSFPLRRNGFTPQKIDLGRILFFDPFLSRDKKTACATCHDPHFGFADGRGRSRGFQGVELPRSAPTLWNVGFADRFFWDGRERSLEEQAKGPLFSVHEMHASPKELERDLNSNAIYRRLFEEVYGEGKITIPKVLDAIADFERTLVSLDSRYDRYVFGEKKALTPLEETGHNVFRSFVARCTECHTPPLFTNFQMAIIGAPDGKENPEDLGGQLITHDSRNRGSFKVPTLRNIARTAPYMHAGVFPTLLDVVHFYNIGAGRSEQGTGNSYTHWHIRKMGLSSEEERAVVAFLGSLTDESARPEIPLWLPSGLSIGRNK
jgi:cytochrome c peroxidase